MSSSDLPDPEAGAPAGVERNGAPWAAGWPEPLGRASATGSWDARSGHRAGPDTDHDASELWQRIWRDALDAGFSVARVRDRDVG